MPGLSVKPLTLTDEQKQKLVKAVIGEIDEAISARSEMEKDWKTAVRQYNGRLERKNKGRRKANIDIPITREYSQQSAARLINPFIQQDRYFICIPRRPEFTDLAREIEEVLDYICDKADIQRLCDQIVKAAHVFSYAAIKVPWVVRTRKIKEWQKVQVPVMDEMGQPAVQEMMGPDGFPVIQPLMEDQLVEQDIEVEDEVGAIPELVPSEDFIYPSDARSVEISRWIAHGFYLNKAELRQRVRDKRYEGDLSAATVETVTRPDFAIEEKRLIGLDISKQQLAHCFEFYSTVGEVRVLIEDDTVEPDYEESCEVIVTIDKTNEKYRRGIHNFFHAYPRPFVTWCYEGRRDGIAGLSLAYILEPIHRAYSAMVCQELDAQSAANVKSVPVRTGSVPASILKEGEIPDGVWEFNGDLEKDLKEFSISQPRTSSPQLRQELQMHAERVAAVSAINFGQDPQQRPTATGQTLQSNEAQQPLYNILESFRTVLAKIALMMLSRYKQFYPEGMPFYLKEDTEDGMTVIPGQIRWQDGAIETQVFIETKVSSGTMNKNLRRQEKLAMVDKIPTVYMTLSQMISQAVMPSPMSAVMAKLVTAYQIIIDDWLTEFEIANKEQINPDLTQEVQIGQMVQQLMQQNAMLMAALQGGAPPGPGGPGAPPGPPGPGGPPPPPPPPPGPMPGGPPGGPMPPMGGQG